MRKTRHEELDSMSNKKVYEKKHLIQGMTMRQMYNIKDEDSLIRFSSQNGASGVAPDGKVLHIPTGT